jgi:hypothetical protein
VVSTELLATLPTSSKSMANLAAIIPGYTVATDVGGSSGLYAAAGTGRMHGKTGAKVSFDGLNTRASFGAGRESPIHRRRVGRRCGRLSSGMNRERWFHSLTDSSRQAPSGTASVSFAFPGVIPARDPTVIGVVVSTPSRGHGLRPHNHRLSGSSNT